MEKILKGRYTARQEESFVVFIIGMRINRFFAFRKWYPALIAMPKMLKELYQNPELGFKSSQSFITWRGITQIQYWRSFEDLERYARGQTHLKAWAEFNKAVGSDGTVGVYHESYSIQQGSYENVYVNMPAFGLGKAGELVSVGKKSHTARQRKEGAIDNGVQKKETTSY